MTYRRTPWRKEKCRCYDCGLIYGSPDWIEAVVPHTVWNKISPTGGSGGILCISCIAGRLSDLGLKSPVWLLGTEPLEAMPSGSENLIKTWKPGDTITPDGGETT